MGGQAAVRRGVWPDHRPNRYVYLSDGGHFENLGLYEMVRRRCRLIVVIDAGCDPDFAFEDLGNAVRKIYIDLGIRIQFEGLESCAIVLRRRTATPRNDSVLMPSAPSATRRPTVARQTRTATFFISSRPITAPKERRDQELCHGESRFSARSDGRSVVHRIAVRKLSFARAGNRHRLFLTSQA